MAGLDPAIFFHAADARIDPRIKSGTRMTKKKEKRENFPLDNIPSRE